MDGSERPGDALGAVLSEIEQEAAALRAAGSPVRAMEAGLHQLFTSLVPGAGDELGALKGALDTVDASTVFDTSVPTASSIPGGRAVKRLLARLVGWYVRWFVTQFERFARAVAAALHVHAEELAARTGQKSAHRLDGELRCLVQPGPRWWADMALQALAGVPGPVLHADCGDGELLGALRSAGVGAYGVDLSADAVRAARAGGVDAKAGDLFEHLSELQEHRLGGVVLEGRVQWSTASECDRLLSVIWSRLAPGGTVVLASASAECWDRLATPVVRDLAPGRPLQPETWVHLLERNGFGSVRVQTGAPGPDGRPESFVVVGLSEAPGMVS